MKVTVYVHENGGSPKAWGFHPLNQGYLVVWGSWHAGKIIKGQSAWIQGDGADAVAKSWEKQRKGYEFETTCDLDSIVDVNSAAYTRAQKIVALPGKQDAGDMHFEEPDSAPEVIWGKTDKNVPWSF